MKKTMIWILAAMVVTLTACTSNVSTTDDGRVNGGEPTASTSGIMDIPDRIEDEIMTENENTTENENENRSRGMRR